MIEYNPKTWFASIISFHRSDTLRILLPEIGIICLFTVFLVFVEDVIFPQSVFFRSTTAVHSLVGVVLGLLLVFRTNTGYERWWEGRRMWGQLLNCSRNLAIKLAAMLPEQHVELRTFFARMIPNYAFALKEHLRGSVREEELEDTGGVLAELQTGKHVPNHLAKRMYVALEGMLREGIIDGHRLQVIDQELRQLQDILGGCERIKNTPIPYSYSSFIKKFLFIYTVTLPMGFVHDFQYWTAPISAFVFYALVSLEILAEEIEDPFGREANDLPTDRIAERIRLDVQEILT